MNKAYLSDFVSFFRKKGLAPKFSSQTRNTFNNNEYIMKKNSFKTRFDALSHHFMFS